KAGLKKERRKASTISIRKTIHSPYLVKTIFPAIARDAKSSNFMTIYNSINKSDQLYFTTKVL
ncbi:MAG: hypothetical protein ACI316_01670, partial [Lactimicrobium massiliense]